MSDASERLVQTRRAIIEQLEQRDRKHDSRERKAERRAERAHAQHERQAAVDDPRAHHPDTPREDNASGAHGNLHDWLGAARRALSSWWRHHPAHMGVEIATPMLSAYAERKPLQYLGIAAGIGALVMVVRPWRLLSVTGVVMALVKSSQLSGLLMSALSAADFQKDNDKP